MLRKWSFKGLVSLGRTRDGSDSVSAAGRSDRKFDDRVKQELVKPKLLVIRVMIMNRRIQSAESHRVAVY